MIHLDNKQNDCNAAHKHLVAGFYVGPAIQHQINSGHVATGRSVVQRCVPSLCRHDTDSALRTDAKQNADYNYKYSDTDLCFINEIYT